MSEDNRQLPAASGAAQASLQTADEAQTKALFLMSQQCPRDRALIAQQVKEACQSVTLAEHSMYCYKRGGSMIMGPSVRLIEEIAQIFGRFRSGWRMLSKKDGATEVYVFAVDLQTLNLVDLVILVPDPVYGNRAASAEDIYLNCANIAARRKRACMERILPTALKEDAVAQCTETLCNAYPDLPKRLSKMVAVFQEQFGVSKDQIEQFLQGKIESANVYMYVRMRAVYNSLTDKASTPATWFKGASAVVNAASVKDVTLTSKSRGGRKDKEDPKAVHAKNVQAEQEKAPPATEPSATTAQQTLAINTGPAADATAAKSVETNLAKNADLRAGETLQSKPDVPMVQEDSWASRLDKQTYTGFAQDAEEVLGSDAEEYAQSEEDGESGFDASDFSE